MKPEDNKIHKPEVLLSINKIVNVKDKVYAKATETIQALEEIPELLLV